MRKPKNAMWPHWPGDTQAGRPSARAKTRPKFVGLNRCLPCTRITNLDAIVAHATSAATKAKLVRRSRHSESAEMSALFGSNRSSRACWKAHWVPSAQARISAARGHETSKSRNVLP
jgi:hypothetical protein